ncbi:MAG: hypothetical protein CSA24_03305 [Deltaproteobacteria bacterium]|nr:MAG: hypothetical protein CSA24_03305 [Deltaproteobacteria bacterium]
MMNNMGLGFVFTARDLASGKMQRLERRFSSLDERVTGGTDRMTSASSAWAWPSSPLVLLQSEAPWLWPTLPVDSSRGSQPLAP